jgi:hypothetical protein
VKLEPEVCRYHYEARRKTESIEQKLVRHKMETENQLRNEANWSNQQQTSPRIIIPTKAARFSRLGPPSDILGESLFHAES